MELLIKRHRCAEGFTLSRLTIQDEPRLLSLDLVEPPLGGLAYTALRTLDPGLYKLFLKPCIREYRIVPVFQKVARRPRLQITPILVETHVSAVSFVLEKPFGIGIRAGRLGGENLLPHKEMYDRLITLLAIAKQRKERLMVHIV